MSFKPSLSISNKSDASPLRSSDRSCDLPQKPAFGIALHCIAWELMGIAFFYGQLVFIPRLIGGFGLFQQVGVAFQSLLLGAKVII